MEQIVVGIVALFAGACLLVFRDKFARIVIDFQNKVFHMKFSESDVMISQWIAILVGAIAIVWGILIILGVWQLKS